MTGQSSITVSDGLLWVRFERVRTGRPFNTVLDAFRDRFPNATWDDDRRAWLLPSSYCTAVSKFSSTLFGPANVRIVRDDTTTMLVPSQARFW